MGSILVDGQAVGWEQVGSYYVYTLAADGVPYSVQVVLEETVSYAITSYSGPDGSINPSGTTFVNGGDSYTFTMNPDTGYTVKDVTVDGDSVGAVFSYTFPNVTGNHVIEVTFESALPYTVTATSGENGDINPSGDVSVYEGGSRTFTMQPDEGYRVADVMTDDISLGALDAFTFEDVTGDHTIHVTFEEVTEFFTITTEVEGEGTITPSDAEVVVAEGASQTFTMVPAQGHELVDVEVDGVSVGARTTYTFADVGADAHIKAIFGPVVTYTITAEAVGSGTITPSGSVVVNKGASQTFTIQADEGYFLADVEVDGVSLGEETTYTFADVTDDHTISVTFEEIVITTYTITATVEGEGTITPSGEVVVNEGASKTFTMEPAAGYKVADVLVDGTSVTSYTFENVTEDHTIHVIFEEAIAEYLIEYDENKDDVTDVKIRLAMGTNVIEIENLQSIHPDDILVTEDKPENMLMGLVSFKVVLENTDNATAQVILDISEAAPVGAGWFMFSDETWSQLPVSNAVFSAGSDGGTLVTLTLTDGGIGDADGEVNGQILVYSGYGTVFVPPVTTEGSGSDNCFIATATNGSDPHNFGGNSSLMLMLMALIAGCAVSFFRRNRR